MAKKELKVQPYLAPMPVLMIATYGENDKVDVMNMAWGGICDSDKVALNIGADHKTSENIRAQGLYHQRGRRAAHGRERLLWHRHRQQDG